MAEPKSFEQIRQEVEDAQRTILWPDALRNGVNVNAFLCKGDPEAKLVQRIGLVLFGLQSLLLAVGIGSAPFQKDFEDGSIFDLFIALFMILISMRLFRNAFLRKPKTGDSDVPTPGSSPRPPAI